MKSLNTLVKSTQLGLAGLGLAGILSFNGCSSMMQNMSDAEVLSAVGTALMVGSDTREGAIAGAVAKTIGDNQVTKEAAREGKDITNIYINSQDQGKTIQTNSRLIPEYDLKQLEKEVSIGLVVDQSEFFNLSKYKCPQFGLHSLFTFNRYLDLNGDGKWVLEEFNPKRNFKKGEPVNIAVVYNETAGENHNTIWTKEFWTGQRIEIVPTKIKLDIKVSDSKGQIVYDKLYEQIFTEVIKIQSDTLENVSTSKKIIRADLGENLGPGIYNVSCDLSSDFININEPYHRDMKTHTGGVFQVYEDIETQK